MSGGINVGRGHRSLPRSRRDEARRGATRRSRGGADDVDGGGGARERAVSATVFGNSNSTGDADGADRRSRRWYRTRRTVPRASYHATNVRLPPRGPGARRMHDRRRPNKEFTWNGRVRAHRQSVKTGTTSRGDVGEFARYQEMPRYAGQRGDSRDADEARPRSRRRSRTSRHYRAGGETTGRGPEIPGERSRQGKHDARDTRRLA